MPDDGLRRPDRASADEGGPLRGTPAWYVVYSKPNKEAVAQFHLRQKGIEVFYPQLSLPDWAPERRRVVPLFPGYLFVHTDLLAGFYDVIWSPGVKHFVGYNGTPAPLADDVIAFLREHATPDGVLPAQSTLKVGQEVEIRSGSFAGLVGIIQRPPDAKGRVRVLMRLLNRRAVRVEVRVQHVNGQWTA